MDKRMVIITLVVGVATAAPTIEDEVDEPLFSQIQTEAPDGWRIAQNELANVAFSATFKSARERDTPADIHKFEIRVDYPNSNYIVQIMGEQHDGRLKVRNADYAFEVLPSNKQGEFILDRAVLPDGELTETKFYSLGSGCESPWSVGPTLLQSFLSGDFQITQCQSVLSQGKSLVKARFKLRPGVKGRTRFQSGIETTIYLDSNRSWLLDHAEQHLDGELVATYSCEYQQQHPLRLKQHEFHWIGNQRETFTIDEATVEANILPEESCRLPHYGISEEAIGFRPKSGILKWTLAGTGILLVIFGIWRKRVS